MQYKERFWLGVGAVLLPELFARFVWEFPTSRYLPKSLMAASATVLFAVVCVVGGVTCWAAGISTWRDK